jgi:hypothetical protein
VPGAVDTAVLARSEGQYAFSAGSRTAAEGSRRLVRKGDSNPHGIATQPLKLVDLLC